MEVSVGTSMKTDRVECVILKSHTFEEERFLNALFQLFKDPGPGRLTVKTLHARMTWKKQRRKTQ